MVVKGIIYALLICTSIVNSFSQTLIPDQNFEQALINLGLDDVLDGQVATTNINAVTELEITNQSISNLMGIEDFVALQFLNVGQNDLSVLDVSTNTNLLELRCNQNQLQTLTLPNSLELLFCHNNLLTELDVTSSINLRILAAHLNGLESIDVSFCENLEVLNLGSNFFLEEVDVSNCPNLRLFRIDENNIMSIDVSQNALLEEFTCGSNPNLPESIDLTNNSVLTLFEVVNTNGSVACVQVSDAESATNGTGIYAGWVIDDDIFYSEDCSSALSVEEQEFDDSIETFINYESKQLVISSQNLGKIKLNLHDISGKIILNRELLLSGQQIKLDIDFLSSGLYLLLISNHGTPNIYNQKIIIN